MSDGVPTYHIIGAGIAGLSAAVYLQQKYPSAQIIVYEAASHPGGRAYSFIAPDWEMALDNATHVILGANRHSLKLCGKGFPAHQVRFYNLCSKTMHITKFACKMKFPKPYLTPRFRMFLSGSGLRSYDNYFHLRHGNSKPDFHTAIWMSCLSVRWQSK